ncbi:MAG TPA: hypothetical protein VEH58_03700 [Dehalococcoidales bacterium]|nr:hypothetical protein [Dehalococcoidales bacterium]
MLNSDNFRDQPENINLDATEVIPPWLKNAIENKDPKLSIALANSVLLPYDDLDFRLLAIIHLN